MLAIPIFLSGCEIVGFVRQVLSSDLGDLAKYGGASTPGQDQKIQFARGIHDDKLALAKSLGADLVVNAAAQDPGAVVQREVGGVHGILITAVSTRAFEQAFDMMRAKGTMALVGLPPGRFATPIFETVLKRITIRGSIVGTRQDLFEALQ